MKKQTKRMLGAAVIILIFGLSSLVFIFTSSLFVNPQQQQQQQQFNLEEYVYFEPLGSGRRTEIIQNGYAVVTARHKTGCCQDIIEFLEFLPESFQNQVVVEILEGDENMMTASSFRGTFESGIETQDEILVAVCRAVLSAPPDCGIILIGQRNAT